MTWLLSLALSWSYPAVSGQLCLSSVQLWAAPSSTSHGSSARGLAGRDRVMPMDTETPLCRGAVSNTSQLRPSSLCTGPGWGKQFPSIFQQVFHNSTLDMPWTCFVSRP